MLHDFLSRLRVPRRAHRLRPWPPARLHPALDLPVTTGAEGVLDIPVPEPTAEDHSRDMWQAHGLRRVRQEDWRRLAGLMRSADKARKLTPGGMSVAELLAFGARADVVAAAEHALQGGAPPLSGIAALEEVLSAHRGCAMIACVVALAHMDLAAAWRGKDAAGEPSAQALQAAEAHLDRARALIAPASARAPHSALVQSVRCELARASGEDSDSTAHAYRHLIDLDPLDTRQMRALGTILLPEGNGDVARLEHEARRIGARHAPIWGAGGYTWVMLDAICTDGAACAALDVEHFLGGMRDILALRPDQARVNLLAAYCAVAMAGGAGNSAADAVRAQIHGARGWIVCEYMTELHPLIWAHAVHGFDTSLRGRALERLARQGAAEARRALSGIFLPHLARGQDVVFTPDGPVLRAAAP